MSDNSRPAADQPRQTEQSSAFNSTALAARTAFQQEVTDTRQPVTDLRGRACATQPGPDEIPTLNPGQRTNGCSYQTPDQVAAQTGTGVLEVNNIWKEMQRSSVHIDTRDALGRGGGSGVVIGEHNNQCIVLTAAHVSSPNHFTGGREPELTSRGVIMPDGRTYPAEVRYRDVYRDRAVMTVRTGDRTSEICHPATFAENTPTRGAAFVGGWPEGSRSQYLSPGQVIGIRRTPVEPGSPQRNPSEIFMISQTRRGNSGAPILDGNNQVIGILTRGGAPHESRLPADKLSIGQPVTRAQADRYMDVIRSQR